MMIRLIYASTVREGVDLNELKRILQQSQANNYRRDLTGILAFNSRIALQALEGARDEVNALYAKLLRDDRHHTVTMLKYQEIAERQWAGWSMGFAAPAAENRAVFLKYSPHSTFNPYAMTGDAAEKMLMELAGKTIAMTVPDSVVAAAPIAAQAQPRPIVARPSTVVPSQPAPLRPAQPQPAPAGAAPAAVRPAASSPAAAPSFLDRPVTRPATEQGPLGRFLGR
ncbi:BLUF domain-containing protein [Ramlibacter tataouinensis]|uniref:BLUF domain-containing protein n=1 Tax=Ramlibacter tataouinensis (strain ATCC BAA-407 / DSM 14655 / LMG 21543 / TTB310) TaxID=365046 RepID=F5XYH6_RAMTT|nr:BLUF domain-containing protein [Ramlibacter tataouinensis]AEG93152.1 hypothetical protein Rta_20590 [Ramlibacter tataouinensis TTB310]